MFGKQYRLIRDKMADDDNRETIIRKFLLDICQIPRQVNQYDISAWDSAATAQSVTFEGGYECIPLITGSVGGVYGLRLRSSVFGRRACVYSNCLLYTSPSPRD